MENYNYTPVEYKPPKFSDEKQSPTFKILRPISQYFMTEYIEDDGKQHQYEDNAGNKVPYVKLEGMTTGQTFRFWFGVATIVIILIIGFIDLMIFSTRQKQGSLSDGREAVYLMEKINPKLYFLDVILGSLSAVIAIAAFVSVAPYVVRF